MGRLERNRGQRAVRRRPLERVASLREIHPLAPRLGACVGGVRGEQAAAGQGGRDFPARARDVHGPRALGALGAEKSRLDGNGDVGSTAGANAAEGEREH